VWVPQSFQVILVVSFEDVKVASASLLQRNDILL